MTPIGLSLGHSTVREADAWLHHLVRGLGLPPDRLVACIHLVLVPRPHAAVSIDGPVHPTDLPPTDPELAAAAEQAVRAHAGRSAGRAVCYPGVSALTGTLTVADLLAASAIERVTVLDGPPPSRTRRSRRATLERCRPWTVRSRAAPWPWATGSRVRR